ncbi:prephenate dehydratase [Clostridium beijerinckii]|uniref:Bifunctional chorismate mutase/prephenate dehydratase n=1 Tax=Clostridium beijerinckii TaxID=1520 RepID=A0AAW3W6L9_CLOBE|nr:prephenate dehydratase [Clostridium beijerinckii]MBC2456283.1 prephenate dehydratase [Clostridium beijerinckii]MBC2474113.1 prephenate dehydratase [Clostridium beijerinckii]NOV62088.1 chorismate mutase/prephenate dehydratase [Clostridium beijerinckii]NOV68416.1 chorismate mutase/prephenate dehydratase [Clostridium beijerinckii]NOW30140.1 chorismate mutase/prephenate dehydratase [Clostridium beijerinckii]
MAAIDDYRNKIDEIDKEITRLFEERMDIVIKVGEYKKQNNLPVFNKAREDEVIEKNIGYLNNKDYAEGLKQFFINIMNISKDLEDKEVKEDIRVTTIDKFEEKNAKSDIKVGFYGVAGSFSEEAMIKHFGKKDDAKAYDEFEDVFLAVKNGEIDCGVLPIENSSTGAISQVYDLLYKYGFYIVGEECIKIDQNLIGIKGTKLDNVKEVYSHPQGFEQSTDFLKEYSNWKKIPFHSTADSVKLVSDLQDMSKVAIASKRAADIYNLSIIKENINNRRENSTRFIVISKELELNNSCDKVSVVFSLEHKAGTLYKLLRHFAENNINMMKIESRPMENGAWKYFLYVDFEGNLENEQVKKALNLIEQSSAYFKLIGGYRKYC